MTQNEDSLKREYSVSMTIERLDVIWKIAQKPSVLRRPLHFGGFGARDSSAVVSVPKNFVQVYICSKERCRRTAVTLQNQLPVA